VKRPMHLRHGDRKYDFSDLEGATDAEVQREIAEIRQGADRLTREAKIWARDADALQEWHNARVAKSRQEAQCKS
jgi:hypothetical protein